MDNGVIFCIMIFSPIVFLISKLSIHYTIIFDILREKHSKTFIKKHKGSFIQSYFVYNFKKEIGKGWFLINALLGILLLISLIFAFIYFILFVFDYHFQSTAIPELVLRLDVILTYFHVISLIYNKFVK